MRKEIEVAVGKSISNTERGKLLEQLAQEMLETMQYSVTQQVRLTGIEVDLLAVHKITGEKIFVECKAWRDPLPADAITKLLGNTELHDASSGWLISAGPLGKDAKGIMETWRDKTIDKRKRLQFYPPEIVVDQLICTSRIYDPLNLTAPDGKQFSQIALLLITEHGRFWAIPLIFASAGLPQAVILFDAVTGNPVSDKRLLGNVSQTDTTLRELQWLPADSRSISDFQYTANQKLENVVPVIQGDDWADYKPSRPQDFVGRKIIQDDFFIFLKDVQNNCSPIRLVAIKSPSGWGKSSLIIKLEDRCKNKRNRNKYFLFHVDLRAAISSQYADLALSSAFKEASDSGFLDGTLKDFKIASATQPLEDHSIQTALKYLHDNNRVLILFFDQFEEIFTKRELENLFDRIRVLATAIDSAKENLVLGFAWKTDSAIPQDHNAYYMWHNLSERRKEFDLTPFTQRDVSSALSIFSQQLGERLNPLLRKIIIDQCQGYPWLVKKFCLHIYTLVREGLDQFEAVARSLDIKLLFEKDTSDLTPGEGSCLKKIATDTPADIFTIFELYGNDTVQSLINRRLVIRRGSRLTLYWDIFRDYILTGKIPRIPITYIPQTGFSRHIRAIQFLSPSQPITLNDLAKKLNVSVGAADNSVRDLVMVGNGIRHGDSILLRQENIADAEQQLVTFMSRHIGYEKLVQKKGHNFRTQPDELESLIRDSLPFAKYKNKTWKVYTNRLIGWLAGVGLIGIENGLLVEKTDSERGKVQIVRQMTSYHRGEFFCEAPPHRIMEAIRVIKNGVTQESQLLSLHLRNALTSMRTLGILHKEKQEFVLSDDVKEDPDWLRFKVSNTTIIRKTLELLKTQPNVNAISVSDVLSQTFHIKWSRGTKIRHGNAALRWAKWVKEKDI